MADLEDLMQFITLYVQSLYGLVYVCLFSLELAIQYLTRCSEIYNHPPYITLYEYCESPMP